MLPQNFHHFYYKGIVSGDTRKIDNYESIGEANISIPLTKKEIKRIARLYPEIENINNPTFMFHIG